MGIFLKKCVTNRVIIKLLNSRRWEGIYFPHSFALTLNICCCPLTITWFRDLYCPNHALYKKKKEETRPDHWESEKSYAPAAEKESNNYLLTVMDSIWKRDFRTATERKIFLAMKN